MTWAVGDLAVCVNTPNGFDGSHHPCKIGQVYTVNKVVDCGWEGIGLGFVGITFPAGKQNADGVHNYRKVVRDKHEACEPEFIQLLKRSKVSA